MSRSLYFAYGSNMLTARLEERVGSARPIAVAGLAGYRLHFHKRGRDGSGKANVVPSVLEGDVVFGVVFEIATSSLDELDTHEGAPVHYQRVAVRVPAVDTTLEALTYVARPDWIDESLRPFGWYKGLVLAGAREHGLPSDHVSAIEGVIHVPDPDSGREARALALMSRRRTG